MHLSGDPACLLAFVLFEEYVPLCLDPYAIFLSGDLDAYERTLYRSLFLFAQLGKGHCVQCVLLFVATLQFWRDSCPTFFEAFRKSLQFTSEEEVEICHSRVRSCKDSQLCWGLAGNGVGLVPCGRCEKSSRRAAAGSSPGGSRCSE